MLTHLDHVIVAVHSLSEAAEHYATLLGRSPSWSGSHPALGTANVLFALEGGALELIAPDGAPDGGRWLADHLERSGEGVMGLVFGTDDADACCQELRKRGLAAADPSPGEGRSRQDESVRRWRAVHLPAEQTRGLLLFAIQREGLELPAAEASAPSASCVTGFDHVLVSSPQLESSKSLYGEGLGLRLALDRSFEKLGLRMLFFRIGGVTVEVVGSLQADPGKAGGDAFSGIAWSVPDLAAARARLVESGLRVTEMRDGRKPGTRVCTVGSHTHSVPTLLIEHIHRPHSNG